MNRRDRGAWLAAGVAALLLAMGGGPGRAQAGGGGDRSFTLTVRGPDGAPLRNHALTVFVAGGTPSAGVKAGPSDSGGRVTVTLPVGVQRLGVIAPGLGFGLAGALEAGPGGAVAADVPPLCPFARLSGTVAPDLRLAGETVYLDVFSALGQARPPVLVDTRGRFTLDDVPPGDVRVVLSGVAGAPPGAGGDFFFSYQLAPGEHRRVVLQAPPLRPPYTTPFGRVRPGGPTRTLTLRGTVTDDAGRPMAGATVYAQVPGYQFSGLAGAGGFGGGMRFGPPPALTATTGADGGYVFPKVALVDPAYDTQITLAAAAAGHAPAVTAVTVPPDAADGLRADLVVSTRHTGLTVRVTALDGTPAAGATVRLKQEGDIPELAGNRVLYSETPYPGMFSLHPPPTLLEDLFTLSGTTGPDGAARFVDLDPGLWDVTAGNGPLPAPAFRTKSIAGVAVQAGQGAVCAVTLTPPPVPPTVRVLGPDGKVVPVQNAALEPGRSPTGTRVFPLNKPGTDPAGDVAVRVETPQVLPGLWRVTANYRGDSSSGGYYGPTIPEPYNEAGALVALSPVLPPPGLIVLHALHRAPGSLRVHLEDAQGRPARGAVLVTGSYAPAGASVDAGAASVDAEGGVVVSGLPSGTYWVQGYLAGEPPPPVLAGDDGPPPSDAALTARPLLLPQSVTVTGDHETAVTLRPRPVGYVRVTLRLTPPDTLAGFYIHPGDPAQVRADAPTNSFLVGPFPPGPVTLSLDRAAPFVASGGWGHETVTVVAGRVTDISMVPNNGPRGLLGSIGSSLYFRGGSAPAEAPPPVNTVYLSDGVTPAWGAQAVAFLPGQYAPRLPERADALGRLLPGTLELPNQSRQFGPPPGGAEPTASALVVWLPGLTGAATLPYTPSRPRKIVLPPALSVSGRVTVGGRSPAGLPGTLSVRAEEQGRGSLNDLLSLDTTAAPDGSFTLNGLTPGRGYLVQAARDGIWLSPTVTALPGGTDSLRLDIGPPGQVVTLRLSPGEAVALDRPAGPLTDELWPATVHADGVGDLRLDGLEAGPHAVRPTAGGPAVTFDVPEARRQ